MNHASTSPARASLLATAPLCLQVETIVERAPNPAPPNHQDVARRACAPPAATAIEARTGMRPVRRADLTPKCP